MKSKYVGITIGPIIRTIDTARFTRELWASSYFFSYFMRRLAISIDKHPAFELIIPALNSHPDKQLDPDSQNQGAGYTPDRIIAAVRGDGERIARDLALLTKDVIDCISSKIKEHFDRVPSEEVVLSVSEIKEYLQNFLQVSAQIIELGAQDNIVSGLSPYLDAAEQTPKLPDLIPKKNHLARFFNGVNARTRNASSFLIQDGFSKPTTFDSLIAIAARSLCYERPTLFKDLIEKHFRAVNQNDRLQEQLLLSGLQTAFPDKLRHFHKHIAIVQADGDSIGSIMDNIGHNREYLKRFSQFLLGLAEDAVGEIVRYGGRPIYVGGDDLFFLAPVRMTCNQKKEPVEDTIFDLCDRLDQAFKQAFNRFTAEVTELQGLKKKPTLSFGVNIEHYKTPLYEGIQEARTALFERAKDRTRYCNGNVMALSVGTHSGRRLRQDIPLAETPCLWAAFRNCLHAFLQPIDAENQIPFNSLARRLTKLAPLFFYMRTKEDWSLQAALDNLVKDNLEVSNDLTPLFDFIELAYASEVLEEYNHLSGEQLVLTLVRTIHFMNRDHQE